MSTTVNDCDVEMVTVRPPAEMVAMMMMMTRQTHCDDPKAPPPPPPPHPVARSSLLLLIRILLLLLLSVEGACGTVVSSRLITATTMITTTTTRSSHAIASHSVKTSYDDVTETDSVGAKAKATNIFSTTNKIFGRPSFSSSSSSSSTSTTSEDVPATTAAVGDGDSYGSSPFLEVFGELPSGARQQQSRRRSERSIPDGSSSDLLDDGENAGGGRGGGGGNRDGVIAGNFHLTFITAGAFIVANVKFSSSFNLYFEFKTGQSDGLIFYSSTEENDRFAYVSVEIWQGHINYAFDFGSGQRVLRDRLTIALSDDQWHGVSVLRPVDNQHILRVDDKITLYDEPRSSGKGRLEMVDGLYIGGVPGYMYGSLPEKVRSSDGFQGCLSSIDLNGESWNMLDRDLVDIREEHADEIKDGCQGEGASGPEGGCTLQPCENGGVCVQKWNSFSCDCSMTSFVGSTCSDDGIAYTFGSTGGLITYTLPHVIDTKEDKLALGFSTTQSDAPIVKVTSANTKDFIEMRLTDGRLVVSYNVGSRVARIGEGNRRVNDGSYHVVRFRRTGSNSSLRIDDWPDQFRYPTGVQMTTFDEQYRIVIGGKRRNQSDAPASGGGGYFQGTIAGLMFNGIWILDLAADSDRRIELEPGEEGDLKLETKSLRPLYSLLSWKTESDSLPVELAEEKRIRDHLALSKGSEDDLISTSDPGCAYEDETGVVDCIQLKQQSPDSADSFIQPAAAAVASSKSPRPSNSSSSRGGGRERGGSSDLVFVVSLPSRAPESVNTASAAASTSSPYLDDGETSQEEEEGASNTKQCPPEDDEGTETGDKRCSSSALEHQSQPTQSQPLQPQSATAGTKQLASAVDSITRLPPQTSYPSTSYSLYSKLFPSTSRYISPPHPASSTAHLGTAPTTASTLSPDGASSSRDGEAHSSSSYSPLHPVRNFESEPDMGQRSSLEYGLGSISSLTMNIALTVGIVCGTVVLISVTIYALVRCGRPRPDPGYYKADPSSKYVYEACETTQAPTNERVGITPTPPSEQQRTNPHKKYVNEWYV